MYNSSVNLRNYLSKHKLTRVVYCGFHHGICILYRKDGAANINNLSYETVNSKWSDLWNTFRGADWPEHCELAAISQLPSNILAEMETIDALQPLMNLNINSLSEKLDLYIKKDLCCLYPDSDETEMDELSTKYATII